MCVVDKGPLVASVRVLYDSVGDASKAEQIIELDCVSECVRIKTKVDWHERHQFLKAEFGVDIRSAVGTYGIQYGHIQRPTHSNTTWDMAKFEVCAHGWMDLSEHGFGVSILTDHKYGHGIAGNTMRLSLLRSPKAPDESADMGENVFEYAVLPHCTHSVVSD
eukprot:Opistho-2@20038